MFKQIVLGLDGSPQSDRAFGLVLELAPLIKAGVTVVHVREMMLAPAVGGVPRRIDEDALEQKVRDQAEQLRDAGANVEIRVIASTSPGGPAHDIVQAARDVGADLIAVGTRGQGLIAGLLLGSVTQRLMQIAPCPVLAAPVEDAG
jgi:nucleotide-binding universal stress UspA family protein